ncbi:MAG TPA: aspartate/glutamate racemase family protein [Acidimicrobiales bacterium]|nr:aspartate/glutamate racemase family protein [Acidimicrobiales bacterium]
MKTIGLLGGMSWESSVEYERIINSEARRRLGGAHSARLVVISYDFADIEHLQSQGRWEEAADLLAEGATRLERAGAEVILLCTNTMHRVADAIERAVSVTFVHIADATGVAIDRAGIATVGLLGTRYTMEDGFYRDRLQQGRDLRVMVPTSGDRDIVHRVIYDELVRGELNPRSRQSYLGVIDRLRAAGAQGVIAGCTEIELLVTQADIGDLAWFPTTRLHAVAGLDAALAP